VRSDDIRICFHSFRGPLGPSSSPPAVTRVVAPAPLTPSPRPRLAFPSFRTSPSELIPRHRPNQPPIARTPPPRPTTLPIEPSTPDRILPRQAVGAAVAAAAKAAGVEKVCFDRGGFLYHGRIEAVAAAAREGGLLF